MMENIENISTVLQVSFYFLYSSHWSLWSDWILSELDLFKWKGEKFVLIENAVYSASAKTKAGSRMSGLFV